ncbi:MAG: photosystem II S4 domain protein [Firmicutes bacterium]|nr:photosystem II S4 domain protein [Bacillota bacterium]
MDRDKILQHFIQETEKHTSCTMLDKIEQLLATNKPQITDFFDPYQQRIADRVLHYYKEIKQIAWGGYDAAERVRILIFPTARQFSIHNVPLACVEAGLPVQAERLTHRDFLGSLLALGLRREKIGDILTAEGRVQVVLHPEVLNFILSNWQAVGKYSIKPRAITPTELTPGTGRFRSIKTTVASLRLDAVASSGFGLSRSKLVPAIRAGQVKLNWQSVKNASTAVKEGDIISVAGRGRVEVEQILGESKKGRVRLLLKKYL